jgi:3'-phosphoadenosine 5'-phosphosulfate sulfotransferase (PAPS reductase)/FAD synthetase
MILVSGIETAATGAVESLNTRVNSGENMRVFPISNWTELDVWQYIAQEQLDVPSIYFAHRREVLVRNGQCRSLIWCNRRMVKWQEKLVRSVRWAT